MKAIGHRASATVVVLVLAPRMAAGQLLPAPPNDLCENAQLIEMGQTLPGTTRGATWDTAPDYEQWGSPVYGTGVWYKIVGNGTPFMTSLTANAGLWVYPYCGGCDYLGDAWRSCGVSDKEYLLLVLDPNEAGVDFSITAASRTNSPCEETQECVQPPNDYCEGAQVVQIGEPFQIKSEGATWDRPGWCPDMQWYQNDYPGLWYRVAGDGTGYRLQLEQESFYKTSVRLYCNGCEIPTCVASRVDAQSHQLSWCSRPGEEHILYVETFAYRSPIAVIASDGQPCDVTLPCRPSPPPSNDSCPLAERISGEEEFEFDLTSALPTPGFSFSDVFYCWTAPDAGQYTVGTCGVTLAPVGFDIFAGCQCPEGEEWVGDRWSAISCGQQANIPFDAVAGREYLIRLYSTLPGPSGPGKFRITKGVPPLPTCNLPLSVSPTGQRCLPPGRWEALESTRGQVEIADDFTLAEGFVGDPGSFYDYDSVCWYGTYFDGKAECARSITDDFEITYYADDCGIPAEIVAGPFSQAAGTLTVSGPALTGATIMDTLPEYQYSAQHARVNLPAERTYWIKITNSADGDCRWYWEAHASGPRWKNLVDTSDYDSVPEWVEPVAYWNAAMSYQDGRLDPLDGFDSGDIRPHDMAFCLAPQLRFELDACVSVPISERCGHLEGWVCEEDSLLPPATNNSCASAESLFQGTFLNTIGATTDGFPVQNYSQTGSESVCDFVLGDEQLHQDVWYTFTPQCSGGVAIGLCDSDFDSKLAVYEDQRCPPLAGPIACSDDDCGQELGLDALVSFHAERERDYRVRVGGYQGGSGIGTLSIVHAPPIAADLRHFAFLAECFTGPCAKEPCPRAPWSLDGPPCCTGLDFDADGDIDPADHQSLVNVLTGP